ncbi:MAG: Asp-tRNA(Asn)/Glu-tRNA(Gln) amidotransferase GatCAB subunit B, partial [Roseitalea porphyridii]
HRFMSEYGLSATDASMLVAERETAAYFEAVAKGRDAKIAANWVTGELFGALNRTGTDIADSPVSAAQLGALVDLIGDGTVSNRLAKDVFEIMVETGDDPQKIVEERGMKQVSDTGAIEAAVDAAIAGGAAQVEQYKGGNEKILGWFVGQVMKATQGKANPQTVNEILLKKLDG